MPLVPFIQSARENVCEGAGAPHKQPLTLPWADIGGGAPPSFPFSKKRIPLLRGEGARAFGIPSNTSNLLKRYVYQENIPDHFEYGATLLLSMYIIGDFRNLYNLVWDLPIGLILSSLLTDVFSLTIRITLLCKRKSIFSAMLHLQDVHASLQCTQLVNLSSNQPLVWV
ncbi:uncharacterized protein CEXT_595891 [Caerostris extrusa]|uniref:Uncharacterized protein n=1 Tax=Caerostris extrusa TaxID=172846 RepID=A0AAV4Y1H9_CAEEX|nr:uncharacterized protein CEXT_595891 [Caerostris extrusa]